MSGSVLDDTVGTRRACATGDRWL